MLGPNLDDGECIVAKKCHSLPDTIVSGNGRVGVSNIVEKKGQWGGRNKLRDGFLGMCVMQAKHSGQFLVGDSAVELVALAPAETVLLPEAMVESSIIQTWIVMEERSHTHGHVFVKIVCLKT